MILTHLVAATDRTELKEMWQRYSHTITKHIIKILTIRSEPTTIIYWLQEIENHLIRINTQTKRVKPNKKFYTEVQKLIEQDSYTIKKITEKAINDYLTDDFNFKHRAFVRECNYATLLKHTNTILMELINIVKNNKVQVEKNKTIKQDYLQFWQKNDNIHILKSLKELSKIIN